MTGSTERRKTATSRTSAPLLALCRGSIILLFGLFLITMNFSAAVGAPSPGDTPARLDQPGTAASMTTSTAGASGTDTNTTGPTALGDKQGARSVLEPVAPLPGARILDRLDGTFLHYRDEQRVDAGRVFDEDLAITNSIEDRLGAYPLDGASTNETREDLRAFNRSTYLLTDADNTSAAVAIGDANRTLGLARDRNVSETILVAAESELTEARLAFAAAQIDVADAGTCCGSNESLSTQITDLQSAVDARADALAQLGTAYRHAQNAQRILHDAGVSRLTLHVQGDPAPGGTHNRTVVGTVAVTSPDEVETAYVEVNNNRSFTVPIQQPEEREFVSSGNSDGGVVANASFALVVELTQPVNRIEATANASLNETSLDPGEIPVAYDVLKLDGDGLTGDYERDVSRTDPMDPDSDSLGTAADEANNGVTDAEEDFDDDGFSTTDEVGVGTNPLAADTDADRLDDRYEFLVSRTDPTDPDTDGNGVIDGLDDPDGDGLTTSTEADQGTDPNLADGDSDGLADPDELLESTDPLDPDTDGDFLEDGEEVVAPFNTNPNDPDTDDDGTVDGNETYTTVAANYSVGVEIEITGQGNVADGVAVENGHRKIFETDGIGNASVSPIAELRSADDFDEATITFLYDDGDVPADGSEADLAVYRYDESLQTFVKLESQVNAVTNTVQATTSHFSTYVLMHEPTWNEALTSQSLDASWSPQAYFVLQNDTRHSVEPLSYQNETIEEFYDYHTASSHTPTALERSETSQLFLYRGPSGTSLVVMHDDRFDGSGGAVSFQFAGLPTDRGSWAVQDDGGDFGGATDTYVNWSWNQYRTDGGAWRGGLNESTEITIEPAFNEEAQQDPLSPGTITDWQLVTGDAQSPTRIPLNMTDSVTVKLGLGRESCGGFPTDEDTDGDGFSDSLEQEGLLIGEGERIQTNASSNDTDGDGLLDCEEILLDSTSRHPDNGAIYFVKRSDPTLADSDGDGLGDDVELDNTWTINATVKDGQPYRWNYGNQSSNWTRIPASSDPLNADTDGDGASDAEEKQVLHTAPNRTRTYAITEEHQRAVIDHVHNTWKRAEEELPNPAAIVTQSARAMGIIDQEESASDLSDPKFELTDSTDDFDFVYDDSDDNPGFGRYTFASQDRRLGALGHANGWVQRSDTWLANDKELDLTRGQVALPKASDPWDPDTDDDGLTDGQEVKGITVQEQGASRIEPDTAATYFTDPLDPDSDGDGYWDGWIGVHGVERTDNVVLYMEHLQTGSGVEGVEMVSEQTGVHRSSAAPSAMTTSLNSSNETYHSNVHAGELHWGTNPAQPGDIPDATIIVEVDYHESTNISKYRNEVLPIVSNSYRLYGINITFNIDDELTNETLSEEADVSQPLQYEEATRVRRAFQDDRSRLHLFVNPQGGDHPPHYEKLLGHWTGIGGVAGTQGSSINLGFGVVIFDDDHTGDFSASRDIKLAKTTTHEVGHWLGAGRADDGRSMHILPEEVYSGHSEDDSWETVKLATGEKITWSVMSSGWNPPVNDEPMGGEYIAFSLEEIATVETNDTSV